MVGSLNLSASARWAFPAPARALASMFAALAGLALAAAGERERAAGRTAQTGRLEGFAAALGHDLRSGMTATLAAETVVARRRNQLDPRGRHALDLLTEELGRQQRLLLDLLDLARAAIDPPARRLTGLLPLVEEVVRRHRSPVELHAQPGASAALVSIHPVRLGRIVANLLDNADRHAGGATAVRVGRTGNQAWVAVEDDGPGVPPAQREHIFTRFRTTPPAATVPEPEQEGPALSLALGRQHARIAGGDLLVEDRDRGGGRFLLLLPAMQAEDSSQLSLVGPATATGAVEVHLDSKTVVLRPAGEIDVANVHHLRAQLEDALRAQPERVLVDLAKVTFLDLSVISALVEAAQRLRRTGGTFHLVNASRFARLLHLVGLHKLAEIRRSHPA